MSLYAAGAMREPGTGLPGSQGPKHFLTDWYTDLFQLKRIPFINYCGEGFYCFYGQPKIRMAGKCIKKLPKNILIKLSHILQSWDLYILAVIALLKGGYVYSQPDPNLEIDST